MKIGKILAKVAFVSGLMALGAGLASADHGAQGQAGFYRQKAYRADSLAMAAGGLDASVQFSYLNYGVKDASRWFAQSAAGLAGCLDQLATQLEQSYPYPYPPYPQLDCSYAEHQAMQAWQGLEHFVSDTYYDLPQVYQQYLHTRTAVSAYWWQ